MKRSVFLFCFLLTLIQHAFPQIESEFREIFLEAESEFLFEEYEEALPDYETLIRQYPDNDNLNYKIGVCLLNNPYRKEESINYLEKAVQNVTLKYRENSFRETRAPLEAYFYLGNAYRINNQLEKAIETYQYFKEQADPELYDIDLVDEQIRACRNAKELMKKPVDIDIQNMGEVINSRFTESNFVVSGDESALVYIQKLAFYDAPFFAEKIDGQWSFPRNLIASGELGPGVDGDVYPVALSYNGDEMIIYRSDDFIGDLYSSTYEDGLWTPIQKLNDNINTKYWESHACFTKSGDTLYFTSNRKGSYGGLDIYYSLQGEDGEWGEPVNLGPTINTRYNEESPRISANGQILYFSSYGHYNIGGYDVFYSTRLDNGEWATPINAGYPINTTDDDVFFMPIRNGTFAYYPRFREDSYGRTDIYMLEIYSETHPRKFQVRGILSIQQVERLTHPLRVAVIGQSSRDTFAIAMADPSTGEFVFEAPAGKYDLMIEGEDIEPTTSTFIIPEDSKQEEFKIGQAIPVTQAEKPEEMPPVIVDRIRVEDTLIRVSTDDTVEIPLTLERNAKLLVDILHDTLLVEKDSFGIDSKQFVFSYKPVPGKNLLKFKMVDRKDRLSFKDVQVIYTPPVAEEPPPAPAPSPPPTPEPVMVEDETRQLQSELSEISSGPLKALLDILDLSSEGIVTRNDLFIYLTKHSEEHNYDTQDVHDLLLKKMQVEYLQDYLDELIRIADNDSLLGALQETDLQKENIKSLQELYESILQKSDVYGFEATQVNQLFSLLSQREKLNELIGLLNDEASGTLRTFIGRLDADELGIQNPMELMSYLIEQSEHHDYNPQDAISLLLKILEEKDLREIIRALIATSSGDLQTLLINLDPDQNQIQRLGDLYNYLIGQANFYDFTEADIMKTFLKLLKVFEKEPLVRKIQLPAPAPERKRTGGTWQFYILGGLLLIILLILFGRRRKSRKEQK